ncbi:hypothetical protein BH11ACT5_BH11ACT5_03680 [soil metagenome]
MTTMADWMAGGGEIVDAPAHVQAAAVRARRI